MTYLLGCKTINETNQNLFSQLNTSLHRGIFAYVRLAFDNNVHIFFTLCHFIIVTKYLRINSERSLLVTTTSAYYGSGSNNFRAAKALYNNQETYDN